jgi:hypothetical protein
MGTDRAMLFGNDDNFLEKKWIKDGRYILTAAENAWKM